MKSKKVPTSALILAGAPNEGKLRESSPVAWEALIKVGSKTLLEHVLNALKGSSNIEQIVIVGPMGAIREELGEDEDVLIVESGDSFLDNILIGLHILKGVPKVLIVTSDIPLLTPEAVDDFLERSYGKEADIYYPVISKDRVDEVYPGTKRTYVRLADGIFTGGNIGLVSPEALIRCQDLAEKAFQMRKKPLQLGRMLGINYMFKFLLGTLTLNDILGRIEKHFGLKGEVIMTPYPQIGVDVDKPEDLELARSFLGS